MSSCVAEDRADLRQRIPHQNAASAPDSRRHCRLRLTSSLPIPRLCIVGGTLSTWPGARAARQEALSTSNALDSQRGPRGILELGAIRSSLTSPSEYG